MKKVVYTVRTAYNNFVERSYTPKDEQDYERVLDILKKDKDYCIVRFEEI